MKSRTLLSICCFVIGFTQFAQARLVGGMSYKELQDGADLIVIAQPIEVRLLNEKVNLGNTAAYLANASALGVETKFLVLATLKGNLINSQKTVVLHHYRMDPGVASVNGPSFMNFDPKSSDHYLMYLKKRNDGQYEGVGGNFDLIISIKKIER